MLLEPSSTRAESWLTARRGICILAVAGLAIVALLAVRMTQSMALKKSITNAPSVPTVSVTLAGVSNVPTTIEIIGTISARYDMPIGVEGDGGRVSAIYVEAGDHVSKGQLLARLNVAVLAPQVANLEAALDESRAEADLAAAEYHRAVAVGAAGALSVEETERRKSSAVTAAAKVKVAAAMLAEAKAKLERAAVRAPADGVILTRNVEVGQTATPGGEALFRLSENGDVELRGQVAEQDLPSLRVGQEVAVKLTGQSKAYPGKVRLLGAVIDPLTRLGTVRVALSPDPNLRPGAFARAQVTVSSAERIVLPQTAVLNDEKGSYVLVVNAEDKLERRPVEVSGIAGNGVTIAAGGLKTQEAVVSTAGAFLQEGELVKPVVRGSGTS
jgi:RND family efflux transporter MFP subunit